MNKKMTVFLITSISVILSASLFLSPFSRNESYLTISFHERFQISRLIHRTYFNALFGNVAYFKNYNDWEDAPSDYDPMRSLLLQIVMSTMTFNYREHIEKIYLSENNTEMIHFNYHWNKKTCSFPVLYRKGLGLQQE